MRCGYSLRSHLVLVHLAAAQFPDYHRRLPPVLVVFDIVAALLWSADTVATALAAELVDNMAVVLVAVVLVGRHHRHLYPMVLVLADTGLAAGLMVDSAAGLGADIRVAAQLVAHTAVVAPEPLRSAPRLLVVHSPGSLFLGGHSLRGF